MKLDIEFNSGAQLPMDAIPALARAAEDSGFDCAWGGEANNKDPTVMLAAVGAVTTRLKLGTAVYHMLGRTPVSMALHAAGLDELSGGRFLFGLGISNPTIANWHGVEFDHPLARIREYLEIVRSALRGDKLDYQGRFYHARGFKLAFKPTDRSMPVYLAAFGPQMSRRTAEPAVDQQRGRSAGSPTTPGRARGWPARIRTRWRSSARSVAASPGTGGRRAGRWGAS